MDQILRMSFRFDWNIHICDLLQVLYLFIVETLNTCFDIMLVYEPLITRYGVSCVLCSSIFT